MFSDRFHVLILKIIFFILMYFKKKYFGPLLLFQSQITLNLLCSLSWFRLLVKCYLPEDVYYATVLLSICIKTTTIIKK